MLSPHDQAAQPRRLRPLSASQHPDGSHCRQTQIRVRRFVEALSGRDDEDRLSVRSGNHLRRWRALHLRFLGYEVAFKMNERRLVEC